MKRNQRYESRLEKRKQNRFLNIAIGLVVLLIVVVAFNLFSGDDDETASTNKSNSEQTTENNESNNGSIEMETDDSKSKADDEDSESKDKEKAAEEKEKTDEEGTEEEKTESGAPEGGGPEGPWQPIGTTQTEPHTKTYDDGSQDWNEMVQALSYATSIPQDQMTIFWLGNGGGPDLSKGTVQSKADGKKYDVMLQWVPEKGWQPTSVTPVQ
ncbi:YrrS family protein [Fictibacillus phosphorivorans]|uniref:YrrS family protein n=1 Tax=Fictibacillus phosphorivorans TaxID=1221500 RepID=UPI001293C706|nr:YrrS family protein [Fictibacillus phosphorivorans]MQR95464.1 DUF1510 family protein [Fictibacillus phosphorivorans]